MERWQNRVVAVTGASSGIGAAVTKDLLKAGMIVVGLARRSHLIEEMRNNLPADLKPKLHAVKCDVCDLKSVNEAFDWIEANLGGLDVLVSNAGKFTACQLLTCDISILEQTMQTNVMGTVYCTRRAYQSMEKRGINDGHIVIINSISGHIIFSPPPGEMTISNIYPPSKFALTALTEIVRQEFRDFKTKMRITSISPGLTQTEMVPDYFNGMPSLQPEDISAGVMYALSAPPHVQVHEVILKPVGEQF